MHPRREIRRFFLPYKYPWGGILMFHRIDAIQPERLWYNEHLKVSPEFLDKLLLSFQKKGFSFISLDELTDILAKKKRVRKILAITLDDGYKDNYFNGLPIFKKNNAPFCIYAATKFPEKEMTFWWYLLEDIILQNESITLSDESTFICQSKQEKEQTFLDIREKILTIPQDNFNEQFISLFPNIKIDFKKYNNALPLTWEMIQQLKNEPLATIGCHTHSHLSMSGCTRQMILDDIQMSLDLMKEKTGIQMHHFAYPFGNEVASDAFRKEFVEKFEFKTIATTQDNLLYHNTDTLQLPRIFVTEKNAYNVLNKLYHAC